jgi:hypothetical protein
MSDEEVRAVYNETAVHTSVGLEWFREELHWRETDRRNRNIERMTFAILALTLANLAFIGVEDLRAAVGAEVEDVLLPVGLVGDSRGVAEAPADLHLLGLEPRLDPEGASGPALAGTAVADRDRERIALDFETKLPAVTGCIPGGHRGET